jgi:hypothetical protein
MRPALIVLSERRPGKRSRSFDRPQGAGGFERPSLVIFSQGQKTLLSEGISFFGDVPDSLRLFPEVLRFHAAIENGSCRREIFNGLADKPHPPLLLILKLSWKKRRVVTRISGKRGSSQPSLDPWLLPQCTFRWSPALCRPQVSRRTSITRNLRLFYGSRQKLLVDLGQHGLFPPLSASAECGKLPARFLVGQA